MKVGICRNFSEIFTWWKKTFFIFSLDKILTVQILVVVDPWWGVDGSLSGWLSFLSLYRHKLRHFLWWQVSLRKPIESTLNFSMMSHWSSFYSLETMYLRWHRVQFGNAQSNCCVLRTILVSSFITLNVALIVLNMILIRLKVLGFCVP